ncbi:MAG: nuclear transport factor 2 family protein [Candidatus Sulfotelmatobacter sp.]
MTSTKDVLDHRLKCFGEGDLEGILADYSRDALLFMPTGLIKGVDAITPVFQHIVSEFTQPGTQFALHQRCVEGDYAYIRWTAETLDNVYDAGTDTFVMRNGKIVAHSFSAKITPKR